MSSFDVLFESREGRQVAFFELPDPPRVDRVERHRIEEVELLAPPPLHRHEIRRFEQVEMLGDGLSRHARAHAELGEGQRAFRVEPVEQLPARGVCEGLEDGVHVRESETIMQVSACMSRGVRRPCPLIAASHKW